MIKLILLDVDGTLTDGGIYRDNNGEEFKKFNVKDGYVIINARKLGIDFGIITGRKSELVRIFVSVNFWKSPYFRRINGKS